MPRAPEARASRTDPLASRCTGNSRHASGSRRWQWAAARRARSRNRSLRQVTAYFVGGRRVPAPETSLTSVFPMSISISTIELVPPNAFLSASKRNYCELNCILVLEIFRVRLFPSFAVGGCKPESIDAHLTSGTTEETCERLRGAKRFWMRAGSRLQTVAPRWRSCKCRHKRPATRVLSVHGSRE